MAICGVFIMNFWRLGDSCSLTPSGKYVRLACPYVIIHYKNRGNLIQELMSAYSCLI